MNEKHVDRWLKENINFSAADLLEEKIPGISERLDSLDSDICQLLQEVREVFPDAIYYTASGGFNLLLGDAHDELAEPQHHREAWSGNAVVGDGDW